MSTIHDHIKRVQQNIENAYESLINNKGASEPEKRNSNNLKSTIDSIKVSDVSYDSTSRILTISIT